MLHLKTYQQKVLSTLKEYLVCLSEFKVKYDKYRADDPEIAQDYNYPKKAWEKVHSGVYLSKQNGLKEPLPDIYLKVPTGGGKTLLACHSIDFIHKTFLKKQTGLVLWIVPSSQIYRQTLNHLRNREHHYRQTLDISSGGRTLIKEKGDLFTRADVDGNLVIFLLMLPSASRQNKETLRMFRDSGGFTDFFPAEDNYEAHEILLKSTPNLDSFGAKDETFGRQIKTSLGNTLRLLKPLIIIDEGHKAYSDTARDTIRNFNPSFLLELSATPPPNTNKLIEVTGKELNEEEMIKLDIHLTNKTSLDWKDTMLCAVEQRKFLEKKARQYEQNTGEYIRPINLIQVERTGADQREKKFIHAEDVKEYLIKKCSVPESHIAIKSSDKDELIEIADIFSKDCEIRYIITKQALQEGWDCSFAYILTILTNPTSQTGITQLIGRILRQPKARKTPIKELNECYVYTYRQSAADLVRNIETELSKEGLGDIAGRITIDSGDDGNGRVLKERNVGYRESFKKFEGKIYLPKFVIQEKKTWRDLNFDIDILSRIDWEQVSLKELDEVSLSEMRQKEQALVIGLSDDDLKLVREKERVEKQGSLEIDESFLTRHILDIVPNPWIGFELGKKTVSMFLKRYDRDMVASNFVFIIEELKKLLQKERDRLSEIVFRNLVKEKKLVFFLLTDKGEFSIPPRIKVRSNKQLVRSDNTPIQRSLFDYVPDEDLNDLEKAVAIYLDQQEKLLWWYRNMSRQHYHIQGWKRHKIYPDFIASDTNATSKADYGNVYVLETKGLHLKNEDTKYKQDVFALCNELGTKKAWKELDLDFPDKKFEFQVIFENEWKSKVNRIIETVV